MGLEFIISGYCKPRGCPVFWHIFVRFRRETKECSWLYCVQKLLEISQGISIWDSPMPKSCPGPGPRQSSLTGPVSRPTYFNISAQCKIIWTAISPSLIQVIFWCPPNFIFLFTFYHITHNLCPSGQPGSAPIDRFLSKIEVHTTVMRKGHAYNILKDGCLTAPKSKL